MYGAGGSEWASSLYFGIELHRQCDKEGKREREQYHFYPHPSFVAALLVLNREDVFLSKRNSLKRCCCVVLHCNIMVKNANRPIKIYSALHSLSQDSRLQSKTRFANLLVSRLSPDLGFLLANVMLSKISEPTIHDFLDSRIFWIICTGPQHHTCQQT